MSDSLKESRSKFYVIFEHLTGAKNRLFNFVPFEQMVSFKGKLPENVNSFVMSAEVNEGISIPFKIILNVACSCQYSKRQCLSLINSPVIYRHFIKFSDTDDSRQSVRERRLEGIITSVTVKGTVKFDFTIPFKKDSNNYSLYEVVIEPALSTLAFTCNRKKTLFSSFKDKLSCAISEQIGYEKHPSFDKDNEESSFDGNARYFDLSDSSLSDLAYINTLCFAYGINYNFAYVKTGDNYRFKPYFSRGSQTLSPGSSIADGTGQLLDTGTITGCVVNPDLRCSLSQNVVNQIFSSSDMNSFIPESYSNFNLLGHDQDVHQELIDNYRKFQNASVKGCHFCQQEKVLLLASDIRFTPGTFLEFDKNTQGIDTDKYLILRSVSKIVCNINYPDNEQYSAQSCFEQKHAAVPYSENNDAGINLPETLGGMQFFSRLEFDDSPESFFNFINPASGSGNDIFEPVISSPKSNEAKPNTVPALANVQNTSSQNVQSEVICAIVCDENGKTDRTGETSFASDSNQGNPNKFYVKTSSLAEPLSVFMTSGVSNYEPCASFPVIGQEVLVLQLKNSNYFMGYPAKSLNYTSSNGSYVKDTARSCVFPFPRYGNESFVKSCFDSFRTGIENRTSSSPEAVLVNMLYKGKLKAFLRVLSQNSGITDEKENILAAFKNKSINEAKKKLLILTNEDGKKEYEQKDSAITKINSKTGVDVTSGKVEIKIDPDDMSLMKLEQFSEYIIPELNKTRVGAETASDSVKKKNLSNRLTQLETVIYAFAQDVYRMCICYGVQDLYTDGKGYSKLFKNYPICGLLPFKPTQTTFISQGDLRLFSGKDTSVSLSEGITFDTEGKIFSHADDEIVISSDVGISLKVGRNSIVLDEKGITLASSRFDTSHPLFSHSIVLDAASGCSINAVDLNISTFSSASISDSFGGAISTKMGSVSLTGAEVSSGTMGTGEIVANVVNLSAGAVDAGLEQIASKRASAIARNVVSNVIKVASSIQSIASEDSALQRSAGAVFLANKAYRKGESTSKMYSKYLAEKTIDDAGLEASERYKSEKDYNKLTSGERNVLIDQYARDKNLSQAEINKIKNGGKEEFDDKVLSYFAEKESDSAKEEKKKFFYDNRGNLKIDADTLKSPDDPYKRINVGDADMDLVRTYFGGTLLRDKDGFHFTHKEKAKLMENMWVRDVFSKIWTGPVAGIGFAISMAGLIGELVGSIQDEIASKSKDETKKRNQEHFNRFRLAMFSLNKIQALLAAIPSYALCVASVNTSKLEVSGGQISDVSDRYDDKHIVSNTGRTPAPRVGEKLSQSLAIAAAAFEALPVVISGINAATSARSIDDKESDTVNKTVNGTIEKLDKATNGGK